MNVRRRVREFDASMTAILGRQNVDIKYAIFVGRITSPAFWASYLVLIHVLWLSPGVLMGKVLLVILLLPFASVLKMFIRRKRPQTLYVNNMKVKSYSFPSSHAYSSALACSYFAYWCITNGAILLAPFILTAALIVGLSRIIVGAHYPSDVLAGWILGLIILSSIVIF